MKNSTPAAQLSFAIGVAAGYPRANLSAFSSAQNVIIGYTVAGIALSRGFV
jgi:hypothetical protein